MRTRSSTPGAAAAARESRRPDPCSAPAASADPAVLTRTAAPGPHRRREQRGRWPEEAPASAAVAARRAQPPPRLPVSARLGPARTAARAEEGSAAAGRVGWGAAR